MRRTRRVDTPVSGTILLVGCLLGLAACGGSTGTATPTTGAASGFPMTVTVGGTTLTFDKPPERIIAKEFEAEYLVAAAGGNMTHKVVAVMNSESDGAQPPDPVLDTLAGVPQISPDADVTKETIIAQRPDLVLGHSFEMAPQDQLKAAGIQSFVVDPCSEAYAKNHGGLGSLDEIYDDIALMGKLLGTESYAQASIAKLKSTVASITAEAPSLIAKLSKPTAAFAYIYNGGFYTYGPPSIADAQIRALGLTNTFSDLKDRGTQLTAEEFIQRDPGLLVIATTFKAGETEQDVMNQLLAYPGIKQLTAVREGHVVILRGSYVLSGAVIGLQAVREQAKSFR